MMPQDFDAEKKIIAKHFLPLTLGNAAALGLNDDAASFALLDAERLVQSVDQCIEGVHFLPQESPSVVAKRALGRLISDLAASAARPHSWLMSLNLPSNFPADCSRNEWLAQFSSAALLLISDLNFPLIGGDITSSGEKIFLSLTGNGVLGAKDLSPKRECAKSGDRLLLSGNLGEAAAFLHPKARLLSEKHLANLRKAYQQPANWLALGRKLRKFRAAAIDVSDGLLLDAKRLAEASALDIVIDFEKLPKSDSMKAFLKLCPQGIEQMLTGGDDYGLIIATDPKNASELCKIDQVQEIGYCKQGSTPEGVKIKKDKEREKSNKHHGKIYLENFPRDFKSPKRLGYLHYS